MQLKKSLLSLLLIAILAACTPATPTEIPATVTPTATPAPSGPWWDQAVFYEIFVRSFHDSDGDGIGDFNGITEKLDYLQELGIKGIWLMPINPSPTYHGYHVTDYYSVNAQYGTMDDFKRLLEEAHKHDIKVIIDLVLNHSSNKHPWFQAALQPGSPYHDWYIWSDTNPGTLGPWNQQVWFPGPTGGYYYAVFSTGEIPDLNYHNPAVRAEAKQITAFWLEQVGVDGFRLDGMRYWVEEGTILADTDANHAFLEEWGQYYRSINPRAFSVGEAWTDNANVKGYVATNTEVDAAFNFDLAKTIISALNAGNNASLRFVLQTTLRDFPDQDNANFLTNHDSNRLMSQLIADKQDRAKVAAAILLTAPGIPFIYYGEEIGMSGTKPDQFIRTPMQWDGTPGAGFTSGKPWEAINADYPQINVAISTGDSTSLLEFYRTLIALRNTRTALQSGKTSVAESNSSKLVAYLRSSEDEHILTLINLDDQPVSDYSLSVSVGQLSGAYQAFSLLDDRSAASLTANDKGGFDDYTPLAEIPGYGVFIIQLTP